MRARQFPFFLSGNRERGSNISADLAIHIQCMSYTHTNGSVQSSRLCTASVGELLSNSLTDRLPVVRVIGHVVTRLIVKLLSLLVTRLPAEGAFKCQIWFLHFHSPPSDSACSSTLNLRTSSLSILFAALKFVNFKRPNLPALRCSKRSGQVGRRSNAELQKLLNLKF